ncbi:hypothetical protein [Roseicitreum antarcticum]|uniref:Uncharacterized protein n=1 Tax=Roseicitreum antarcticum TaxID=564137 RepID=A0A1H2XFM3_9RHOB|nr:hypothetical protein [Roseicitreum antarcticum]SDW91722.1 hypothetical protein SAMN04488238_104179 [Roseicitreum antarcticum]
MGRGGGRYVTLLVGGSAMPSVWRFAVRFWVIAAAQIVWKWPVAVLDYGQARHLRVLQQGGQRSQYDIAQCLALSVRASR